MKTPNPVDLMIGPPLCGPSSFSPKPPNHDNEKLAAVCFIVGVLLMAGVWALAWFLLP